MFRYQETALYFICSYRPGGIPARNYRGERLLLYIGIIDILQSYRLAKKLEHAMKALIHDGVRFITFGFFYQDFIRFIRGLAFCIKSVYYGTGDILHS